MLLLVFNKTFMKGILELQVLLQLRIDQAYYIQFA